MKIKLIDKIKEALIPEIHNVTEFNKKYETSDSKVLKGLQIERELLKDVRQTKPKARKLEETETKLEDVSFIPFEQESIAKKIFAKNFVYNNIQRQKTKYIFYPYAFSYTNKTGTYASKSGGAFTLDETLVPSGQENWWISSSLDNMTTVNIMQSKALYDIHIGIIRLDYLLNGINTNLFTESDLYCNYFVQTLSKIGSCLNGLDEFNVYVKNNPNKGAISLIYPNDLNKDILFDSNGKNSFGLLIIPDFVYGTETIIKDYFTDDGIERIKKFINQGGNVLASGKSGYLLELWGLISLDSYKTDLFLISTADNTEIKTKGCENTKNKQYSEQNNFILQTVCLADNSISYTGTSFPMKSYEGLELLMSIDVKSEGLGYKTTSGFSQNLNDDDTDFPFVLSKEYGKGRIWLINGQPLKFADYGDIVSNIAMYSMGKNIIFDAYIGLDKDEDGNELPIPGGESGVLLEVNFNLYNLYTGVISNYFIDLFIRYNLAFYNPPSGCQLIKNDKSVYNFTSWWLNNTAYLRCKKDGQINKFEKLNTKIKLEIVNSEATEQGSFIGIVSPYVYYFDETLGQNITIEYDTVTAKASYAAILRATMNPDPPGNYPIKGQGAFIDNVLSVENKEDTKAKNVKYISIVPLISPIFGLGEDTIKIIELYKQYYKQHSFTFPWSDENDVDYIDYAELLGKNIIYVADWDTPVKITKIQRDEITPYPNFFESESNEVDIGNNVILQTTSDTLLKEIYFGYSDVLYEKATQRTSLFINTTSKEGAKLYYDNNIGEDEDLHNSGIAKTQVSFMRNDIFFYSRNEFQNPNGIENTILISVDKYDTPNKNISGSTDTIKNYSPYIMKKGHYDSSKDDPLVANEWSNQLLQADYLTKYDPTNVEDMQRITEITNGKIKLTHYLVRNTDFLEKAGSYKEFTENADGSGYLNEYPDVKLIFAHIIAFPIPGNYTRLGGKIEITLNTGFKDSDPVKNGEIQISADNVAFYKTEYDSSSKKISLYFKRGLLPTESAENLSACYIYLENIDSTTEIIFTTNLYKLIYDTASKETNYDTYEKIDEFQGPTKGIYTKFWSLPALEIENNLERNGSSDMKEYELINPFSKYGIYSQEILKHRTIWGSCEAHHIEDPGLQTDAGGFCYITQIGTSFIPSASFLSHADTFIPAATSTSRLEWEDVWGRHWSQPVRSIYPDGAPIPGPVKNLMMSTTYEVLVDGGRTRVMEWPSDEQAIVHVQMKFKSNYPKFFSPEICQDNQFPYMRTIPNHFDREFTYLLDGEGKPQEFTVTTVNGDEYDVGLSHSAQYGKCYSNTESYLSGQQISSSIIDNMNKAKTCSNSLTTSSEEKSCVNEVKYLNLPLLSVRDDKKTDNTPGETWNYSPIVEKYYPTGYIDTSLWDLTCEGCSDTYYNKGVENHIDNNIPGLDVWCLVNEADQKPHNFIVFPIFKGSGFKMDYNHELSIERFSNYKGWWSDNLQSKDSTLLAGQDKSNEVSVGQNSLLKESDFIRAFELKNTENENNAKDRLKNIYVCQFNQKRLKITPNQSRYAFPNNVYNNYAIPIYPDMEEDDDRYTKFECKQDFYGYDMKNISEVNNRLITSNDRDWLYYSVALRGGAKENINVLLTLSPYELIPFEGSAKIQDGGRFTYWNPGLGTNAFMYFDNNVNTVISKRVDYDISSRFLPSIIHTFNTVAYQLIVIEDTNEELREYTYSTYFNSYGFGDSVVSVYVGGTDNTNCRLNPGENTIVKITFYNNAGFDWNMYGGAITSNSLGTIDKSILMKTRIHTVKVPSAYNFLKLTIPPEIENYIIITVSEHMSNIANQVFDFSSNNVVMIIDGYEGNYYYNLKVKENFPNKFRGRLWEIKIEIDESYFDRLPGYNDPTGVHDYTLKVPSFKFGVPYPDTSKHSGKIYYTLGRGSQLKVSYQMYKYFQVDGIKFLSDEKMAELINAQSDAKNIDEATLNVWKSISTPKNGQLSYEFGNNETFYRNLTIDISSEISELPYEIEGEPDVHKFNLLVKINGTQAEYGYMPFMKKAQVSYYDGRKYKISVVPEPSTRYATSSGPWITLITVSTIIVVKDDNGKYIEALDQNVYPGDAGTVRVTISALNSGNQPSYGTSYNIILYGGVEVLESELEPNLSYEITENSDGTTTLTLNTEAYIDINTLDSHIIYLNFGGLTVVKSNLLRRLDEKERLIKDVLVNLCQENKCEKNSKVTQVIELDLGLEYKKITTEEGKRGSVVLKVEKLGTFSNPKYTLSAETNNTDINYIFYRKLVTEKKSWEIIQNQKDEVTPFTDSPKVNDTLDSYDITYRVEIYDKINYRFVASSTVLISEEKEIINEKEEEDFDDNKEKNSKTWVYIVIGILGVVIVIGIIVFLIIRYKKKTLGSSKIKVADSTHSLNNNIKSSVQVKTNDINSDNNINAGDILQLKEN